MCNVIFTDKKLPCKLLQRQLFIEMVINIINNVLIKILFLFLALWILLFVDNTVQLKNKIIHTEGNLCLFSKTLRLNLLDQLENPILDRIKRDQVIVKNIFFLHQNILHQISVRGRNFHQLVAIFHTDPEYKSPVRDLISMHHRHVLDPRRYQHHISIF